MREDVARLRDLGVTELLWFTTDAATVDDPLRALDRVRSVAE